MQTISTLCGICVSLNQAVEENVWTFLCGLTVIVASHKPEPE